MSSLATDELKLSDLAIPMLFDDDKADDKLGSMLCSADMGTGVLHRTKEAFVTWSSVGDKPEAWLRGVEVATNSAVCGENEFCSLSLMVGSGELGSSGGMVSGMEGGSDSGRVWGDIGVSGLGSMGGVDSG